MEERIAALWATSSSGFLLNGEPGLRIRHKRGMRQGDPLSPMLFLLAMEYLHLLFCKAQSMGTISFLHQNCTSIRMSRYADDAAVFINPSQQDLQATSYIMQLFADASGLSTNMDKTEFYPIQCHGIEVQELLGPNRSISNFPCSYLEHNSLDHSQCSGHQQSGRPRLRQNADYLLGLQLGRKSQQPIIL
jgi:hypothetical protein